MKNLADYELSIANGLTKESYMQGKKFGYSNDALEQLSGSKIPFEATAKFKRVDTMKGAFGSMPYYYSSFDDDAVDEVIEESGKEKVLVLGSGPIRIGQGIEFDYSSVKCVEVLRKLGYEVIIINNNPETVSTDYDTADRLYFEPVGFEDVMNVVKKEKPLGVVVAFGGQTAIKLAGKLDAAGVRILGTSAEGIDVAEDRERFDAFLGSIGISRPKAVAVETLEEAKKARS
ncbi:MAG: hypothetical protein MJ150_00990 [Clostridia bacterium]|nr:hypothetical protein [Clostridia bacterium]